MQRDGQSIEEGSVKAEALMCTFCTGRSSHIKILEVSSDYLPQNVHVEFDDAYKRSNTGNDCLQTVWHF